MPPTSAKESSLACASVPLFSSSFRRPRNREVRKRYSEYTPYQVVTRSRYAPGLASVTGALLSKLLEERFLLKTWVPSGSVSLQFRP